MCVLGVWVRVNKFVLGNWETGGAAACPELIDAGHVLSLVMAAHSCGSIDFSFSVSVALLWLFIYEIF